ncbi:membrane protein insertion efficiency factor YidD [bacterium]|nr:membrane protein insertion efficiency factor YidD [bacterium]MBU1152562.1 membrane protein insertion efficiency factor YidD [bacterium]
MAKLLISVIRFYQAYLSVPFKGACIYTPSCSQYSIEAIEKYGSWRGLKLSISRLMRCSPPYKSRHDPVE